MPISHSGIDDYDCIGGEGWYHVGYLGVYFTE